MQKAAVIIPNYNGIAYIRGCLDSLQRQTAQDFSVIVVDNGSTDGSREIVQEEYPWVRLICLPENTGFCGAVNRGIRAAQEPYVILLNNDTTAEPDFVQELLEGIARHRRAFACGAKMLQASDSRLIDGAGDLYTALGWAVARGNGRPQEQYQREEQVFSACGGAAIYRRRGAFRLPGGFGYLLPGPAPRVRELVSAQGPGGSCGQRHQRFPVQPV